MSAATLHPRRSEVNSVQCTPIQPHSAHFRTFTYGSLPKILPELFLYIMDTPDSILVSNAGEMVAFQCFGGIAGARAQIKSAKYFFTIGFLINYTGRIFRNYMYHIIRLHFLVDWDFLQVRIFIFIVFTVVLVPHGP